MKLLFYFRSNVSDSSNASLAKNEQSKISSQNVSKSSLSDLDLEIRNISEEISNKPWNPFEEPAGTFDSQIDDGFEEIGHRDGNNLQNI